MCSFDILADESLGTIILRLTLNDAFCVYDPEDLSCVPCMVFHNIYSYPGMLNNSDSRSLFSLAWATQNAPRIYANFRCRCGMRLSVFFYRYLGIHNNMRTGIANDSKWRRRSWA